MQIPNFFHRMANSNIRNNGIESLMVDGILSSNQGMIADYITQFFMSSKLFDHSQKSWSFQGYPVIMQIGSIDPLRRQKSLMSYRILMGINHLD